MTGKLKAMEMLKNQTITQMREGSSLDFLPSLTLLKQIEHWELQGCPRRNGSGSLLWFVRRVKGSTLLGALSEASVGDISTDAYHISRESVGWVPFLGRSECFNLRVTVSLGKIHFRVPSVIVPP